MDQHSSDRQASQASGARGRNRNANRRWGGLQDLLAKAGLGGFEDPSVTTDQTDYGPGETAVITAKGFKRGDRINFAIADDPQDPGDDGDADVYAPFSVRDGSPEDGDGTINGQVVAKWIVPRDNNGSGAGSPDALNATLHLKAKGSHGAAATTSFTDSTVDAAAGTTELADPPLDPPVPAVSLDQSDYEPGETATITASGFALGSAVAFAIADDPDQPGDDGEADVYVPFAISDGSADDLDGLANGEVVTTWVMPADGNAALNVTAMGAEGESASASATISAATVAAATNPLAPTVSTDQSDYAPNETATITASGFTPGSSVEFGVEIVSDPGGDGVFGTSDDVVDLAATQLLAETPWLVVDGSAADLDPAEGSVQTTWLVDPDALNRTLRLTARGFGPDGVKATLDDEVATTSFTDAQGSFSKPYAHWSDEPLPGDWNNNILNDNKSNYFEGEVIPHVFMYGASNNAQLVNGQSYSFNVTYNWYQQNTDAGGFAYMTQYDLSRQPNVFDWATPAITPTADGAFTNAGGMLGGSNFYTVDADITSVSAVSYTGTGTKDGHVTLTFTYTGTTTRNGYAAIYYGLYVAKPGEVPDQGSGKTNGANAWSGGSLQTTVDIGGSGATSLQLAPSAIIPGEISGLKFNDLNGNGTKDTGELGLAGWTICLDSDSDPNNGDLGCVQTANGTTDDLDGNSDIDPLGFYYFSVTPGTYYVREVNQAGWTQTAPTSGSFGPLTVSATTPTYLNQNFGNRQLLTISGTKFTDANGDGLTIGDSGLGGVTIFIDVNGNLINDDGAANQTMTAGDGTWSFSNLGTSYAGKKVYEVLPSGYVQTLGAAGYAITGTDQRGLDFANFEKFDISGYKFIDIVGDGVWGPVDPSVPNGDKDPGEKGWAINLSVDTNKNGILDLTDALVASDVTDDNGQYQFTGLGPLEPGQQYIVWESPFPEGDTELDWTRTFNTTGYYTYDPASGQSFAGVEGSSAIDEDGEGPGKGNFGNFKNLDLGCYKWIDTNGNGAWDEGEAGANGWSIYLDNDDDLSNGVIRTETTDTEAGTGYEGFYEFQNITPEEIDGALTLYVYEEIREGFVKTFGGYTFDVQSGEIVRSDYGIAQTGNFGNFELFDISGYKFIDIVGDGVWGPVDPNVPNGDKDPGEKGWTINLSVDTDKSGTLNAGDAFIASDVTDETGQYQFTDLGPLKPGEQYIVWESPFPEGDTEFDWTRTFNTSGYYLFDPVSGQSFAGVEGSSDLGLDGEGPGKGNFGNFKNLDLGCYKWIDTNGNGAWDEGEAGANGWVIYLDNDDDLSNGFIRSETTDTEAGTGYEGFYEFQNITPEEIDGALTLYVYEEIREGFVKTFGGYTFDVQSGEIVRSDYGIAQTGNFANFELFDISGTKFTDSNGDGETNGDIGLGGVTVFIDMDDSGDFNAGDLSTTTADDGTWSFTGLDYNYAGLNVFEVLPDGYTQTLGMAGYGITGTSGTNQEDLNFANFELFDISGTKFTDSNGDGETNGDIGLGGVTVFIDMDDSGDFNAGDLSTTTADDGTWSFTGLDYNYAGLNVFEVLPDGYTQTLGMAGYGITGTSGTNQEDLNFANFELFDISGTKFTDSNGDGETNGDIGLGGVTVFIDMDDSGDFNAGDLSTTTADDGTWSFTGLDYNYAGLNVFEVLPDGYTQTLGMAGYGITGTSGTNQEDLNFANFELFDISGTKFTDSNGDGETNGDIGLGGVTVFIDMDDSGDFNAGDLSTTTADDGTWSFTGLDYNYAGLNVFEVLPDGYTQTLGMAGYGITGTSGTNQEDLNFANFELFDISGTKFTDSNGDGETNGDIGLGGVTVFIDMDDSGDFNAGDLSTTTADDGTWSFTGLDYNYAGLNVFEVLPDGYTQTLGMAGYGITGTSGTNQEDLNFANFELFDISGTKFTDSNGDGETNGDIGLGGVTVFIDMDDSGDFNAGDLSTTTADDGTWSFTGLDYNYAGLNVFEVLPDGYTQTLGMAGYGITGTSGTNQEDLNFANFELFDISGTKFTDSNGDGETNGDIGLGGVTVFIDMDDSGDFNAGDLSTTTADDGTWSFTGLDYNYAGLNVFEVLPDGYTQTLGMAGYGITGTSGTNQEDLNFANFELFDISGTKFTDSNGDGETNGDIGLGGVTVFIDMDDSGDFNAGDLSTTTADDGTWSFTGLDYNYAGLNVFEVLPDGYTQTLGMAGYGITGTSGTNQEDLNFANFELFDISGTKFTDSNGDGETNGDIGLGGVTVFIDMDDSGDFNAGDLSTTTADDGTWSFTGLDYNYAGLNVFEVLPDGYTQTLGMAGYGITGTSGTNQEDLNFANFELFDISGTKFTDSNGDGETNGDIGLGGVTVFIDMDDSGDFNAGDLSTTTADDGTWSFTGLDYNYAGLNVFEVLPDGYTQTLGMAGYGITGTSGTNQEDLNFANFELFDISGTKFTDSNGDGETNGDIGLGGVTVFIDMDDSGDFNAGDLSTTTADDGTWSFTGLDYNYAGLNVFEVLPDGYTQTLGMAGYGITGTSGTNQEDLNFANFELFDISGTKFTDSNGDGETNGDIGLGGVTVFIDMDDSGDFNAGDLSTTTADDGTWSFTGLDYNYAGLNVFEVLPDGYTQTLGMAGYGITGTSGTNQEDLNFANFELFDISGTKFTDSNGDGETNGDIGLGGVTIFIDMDDSGDFNAGDLSTTTADDGTWSFTGLDYNYAGLNVFEVLPDGYTQTLGMAGYGITGTSGTNQEDLNFANFELFDISGTKFTDSNGDGETNGDIGLGGVTVFIDMDDSGDFNAGDLSTTTADDGTWSFTGLDYNYAGLNVFEVLPDGYTQTLGMAGYGITGTSGTNQEDLNFANFELFDISGTKFNDLNADGKRGDGELGLGDVTIYIDTDESGTLTIGDLSTKTASDGTWSFPDLNYTVAGKQVYEILPSGYAQTLGMAGYEIIGTSGADQRGLDFGNVRVGACGLTPGFWLGGAANPRVKGVTTSIWDGVAYNDGGKLLTLRGTISDVVIDKYGDVLLTPEFSNKNVVKRQGSGPNGVYQADDPTKSVSADFALGLNGSLRNFGGDSRLDQIYIEHFDARQILGTKYQPGDRFGALLRKDLAMILDVAGQQDYAQVAELRNAIYDWVGSCAFSASKNFVGPSGQGILTELGDVNQDGVDDWVINYQAAVGKKGSGFGADGKFVVSGSSASWTTGGSALPTPPSFPENTYAGQLLFDVLSAQFEGSCNLDVTLDGSRILTAGSDGLTNGIYDNNGNLSLIASTLPAYGI